MKIKNHKHKWEKTPFIGNVIGENKELRLYLCSVCKCVKWDKDKKRKRK